MEKIKNTSIITGITIMILLIFVFAVAAVTNAQENKDTSTLSAQPKLIEENVIEASGVTFLRSDANADGLVSIADAAYIVWYVYSVGASMVCADAADVNDDGAINAQDADSLLSFLFQNGSAPASPYPSAGTDLSADSLDCGTGRLPFAKVDREFMRGDSNGDGVVNIVDATVINNLLQGNSEHLRGVCLDAYDVNDDGVINTEDSERLLNYLFKGGAAPAQPHSQVGFDKNAYDFLTCDVYVVTSIPPITPLVDTTKPVNRPSDVIVPVVECSDKFDNDGDGNIDLKDLDCRFASDNKERSEIPNTSEVSLPKFPFLRGDSNGDGVVNIADAVYTIWNLNSERVTMVCADAADFNDDGSVNYGDVRHTLSFLFSGGISPATPYPAKGIDPTDDRLGCEGGRVPFSPRDNKFKRGDANGDGEVNIADAVYVNQHLTSPEKFVCLDAADVNDDGILNLLDSDYLLAYLFKNGPLPAAPFLSIGFEEAENDFLSCAKYHLFNDGDLVQEEGRNNVYWIKRNRNGELIKRPVKSGDRLVRQFGTDVWERIKVVALGSLDSFQPFLPSHIGDEDPFLVKDRLHSEVFLVKDNMVHWIPSEDVFHRLGYKFENVTDVDTQFFKGKNFGPQKID